MSSAPTPPAEPYAALQRALADMSNPGAETVADMGTYKIRYTTLAALLDHVRPILAAHGLGVSQYVGGVPGAVTVRTVFVHERGLIDGDTLTMDAGRGPQAAGSAISYARRYSLAAACGIASDVDDDAKTAQQSATAPLASEGQIRTLAIRMANAGIDDRDARLAWVNAHLDREVASSKELTTAEAGRLLKLLPDNPPPDVRFDPS